jgi:hypothetical protein
VSGYVASARIVRASPRLARAGATRDPGDWRPAVADAASIVDPRPAHTAETTLSQRLDAMRERWAQLTFFLLDGESWRT